MSTTSIRLPDALKARVAKAAKHAGITQHAFILEAIAEKTGQTERRTEFHKTAEARLSAISADGQTIAWDDMRRYLLDRLEQRPVRAPAPRRLGD
jgi:predicted transcriptional regulator